MKKLIFPRARCLQFTAACWPCCYCQFLQLSGRLSALFGLSVRPRTGPEYWLSTLVLRRSLAAVCSSRGWPSGSERLAPSWFILPTHADPCAFSRRAPFLQTGRESSAQNCLSSSYPCIPSNFGFPYQGQYRVYPSSPYASAYHRALQSWCWKQALSTKSRLTSSPNY